MTESLHETPLLPGVDKESSPTTTAAPCGAQTFLGSVHDDYPVEFTCDLPVGHDGWHRDLGDEDEYRWAPSSSL